MFILISSWWVFFFPVQTGQDRKEGRESEKESVKERETVRGYSLEKEAVSKLNCWRSHKWSKLTAIFVQQQVNHMLILPNTALSLGSCQIWSSLLWSSFDSHSISFTSTSRSPQARDRVLSTLSLHVVITGPVHPLGSTRSWMSTRFLKVILWYSFRPCGC